MSASLPTPAAPADATPRYRTVKQKLAHAGLPTETTGLIRDVLRRTRLSRREKRVVADELIAHFRDAAAAGTDPAPARDDFGDPAAAAQLIRRAKLRNRSLLHRGFIWTRRAAVAVVAVYLALVLWMLGDRPQINVDYLALVNSPIVNAPYHEKAWPIYRDAWIAFGGTHLDANFKALDRDYPGLTLVTADTPFAPNGTEGPRFFEEFQGLIDATRRGAALPRLGLASQIRNENYAPEDAQALSLSQDGAGASPEVTAEDPDWIINARLPQISALQVQTELLITAAGAELQRGNPDRAVEDLVLISGLARQAAEPGFLVCGLVGVSFLNLQTQAIAELLAVADDRITPEHRDRLRRAMADTTPAELVHVESERMFVEDTLQRMYTDNGRGGGRLTAEGLRLLARATGMSDGSPPGAKVSRVVSAGAAPLVGLGFAGRAEVAQVTDTFFELLTKDFDTPLWKQPEDRGEALIASWSGVHRVRYFLATEFFPALGSVRKSVAWAAAPRDALRVALALHQTRTATGGWPADLAALVPDYLNQLPVDPITGGPLLYRLIDGHPVIYSVGDDRDNDGARPATGDDITNPARAAATWTTTDPVDGDWILFDARPAAHEEVDAEDD